MNLSIIIPVYNGEKFIDKCLNNICIQIKGSKDVELIIVDDFSKDNSLKILKKYQENYKFIKLIKSKKNLGTAASRDTGSKIATGKYLFFVDIDDSISDNSICIILKNLESFPNKDLFVIRNYIAGIKKNEKLIDNNYIQVKNKTKSGKKLVNHISNYYDFRPTAWNFIFNKKFLKKNSIYFNKLMRTYEDCPFVAKAICSLSSFKVIEEPIYIYQRHNPNSLSVSIGFICVMSNLQIIYDLSIFIRKKKNLNNKEIKFLISIIKKRFVYAFSDILVCSKQEIKIISQLINNIKFIFPYLSKKGFNELNDFNDNCENRIYFKLEKYKKLKLDFIQNKLIKFNKKKIILFCVGRNGSLTSRILQNLGLNISMFVDNNSHISSQKIENIKIYSPKYLINKFSKLTNHLIIICDNRIKIVKSIKKQLKAIGFDDKNILSFGMF